MIWLWKKSHYCYIIEIIILDFSKAFNSVNHRNYCCLNSKTMGIIFNLCSGFNGFERSQTAVYLDRIISVRCDMLSGAPSGSVPGSFLFYINDLPQNVFWLPFFCRWCLIILSGKNHKILQKYLEWKKNCGNSLLTATNA